MLLKSVMETVKNNKFLTMLYIAVKNSVLCEKILTFHVIQPTIKVEINKILTIRLRLFNPPEEVNEILGMWCNSYNFDRPHTSLKHENQPSFEKSNPNLYFRMIPTKGGVGYNSHLNLTTLNEITG
jgi:hypothetical protein